MCSTSRSTQRGAALITSLLVVALTAIIVTSIASQQQLDLHRASNIFSGQQIMQYALGGEALTQIVLERDFAEDKAQDTLFDMWAEKAPVFPIEQNGLITGRIEDLQGRFNINNLQRDGKPSPVDIAQFRRLLRVVGLDEELAFAVVDWVDSDDDSYENGGAESAYYLGLPAPYRPPNRAITTTRELLLVKGIDQEVFNKLEPLIAALPEGVKHNVNTMSEVVLESLDDALSASAASTIVADRKEEGYKEIGSFLRELEAFGVKSVAGNRLSLSSSHFVAIVEVRLGELQMRLNSYLYRNADGIVAVTYRTQELF